MEGTDGSAPIPEAESFVEPTPTAIDGNLSAVLDKINSHLEPTQKPAVSEPIVESPTAVANEPVQVELAGRTEYERDNLQYLPAMADLDDPRLAQELLAQVEAADSELERAIRIFEFKDTLNRQLIEQAKDLDKPDETTELDQTVFPDWTRVRQLQAILTSSDIYRDLATILTEEEMIKLDLAQHKGALKMGNRVIGRVFNKSSQAGEIKRANYAAKVYIEESIRSAVDQFQQAINSKQDQVITVSNDFTTTHRQLVDSDDEKTADQHYQAASQRITDIKAIPQQLRAIKEQLVIAKEMLKGGDEYRIPILERKCSELESSLKATQDLMRLDLHKTYKIMVNGLDSQIGNATRFVDSTIWKEFPDFNRGGTGAITKEYERMVARINLRQANLQTYLAERGSSLTWPDRESGGHDQVTEARAISGGRILTHTAVDAKMYAILREGRLSSAAALDARGLDSRTLRTFTDLNSENDRETHEVCFVADRIYGIEGKTKQQANMAIVLSENHLLSQGMQFTEHDGLHVFPPDYDGSAHQDGLDLDLTQEPCMILVNSSLKDEFIKFLREESRWSSVLNDMTETEMDDWLAANVAFVDSVADWKADDEFKSRFNKAKNIRVRKGVVFGTLNEIRFKAGSKVLRRFKPGTQEPREALAA